MAPNEQGQTAITEVTLYPQVQFAGDRQPTPEELHTLHQEAHEQCFLAHSVKTQIHCKPVRSV